MKTDSEKNTEKHRMSIRSSSFDRTLTNNSVDDMQNIIQISQ